MKRKYLFIFIFVFLFTSVIIILYNNYKNINSVAIEVETLMENMTIEEKISQMLILNYDGNFVDGALIETLNEKTPGGFIITKENITTFDKTKKFIDDLKSNSKIPLIISVDQEGGRVQRLQYLSDVNPTDIPYMYYLGKTNDIDLSYEVGKVMAYEMRTLGINVVYAPVLDVYSNYKNTVIGMRSFGSSSELVSEMAISLAKGLEDNGIIATYKHFPGHGDTAVDSHYNLPIINKTKEELSKLELIPFKNAISNNAKIIMVGHIAFPDITGNNIPASLSKTIVTDLLKKELGYDGLVITDALNMKAVTKNYSEEEIHVKAIQAGCDLLLMSSGSSEIIEYIKNNISEDRIDESVKKILLFKYKYLSLDNSLDKSYLGDISYKQVIDKIPVFD